MIVYGTLLHCLVYLCNLYLTIKSILFSLLSPQPPSSSLSLSPLLICLLWSNDGRFINRKHHPHPRGQYRGLSAWLGLAEGLSLLVHAGLASIGNIIFVMHIKILITIVLDLWVTCWFSWSCSDKFTLFHYWDGIFII